MGKGKSSKAVIQPRSQGSLLRVPTERERRENIKNCGGGNKKMRREP